MKLKLIYFFRCNKCAGLLRPNVVWFGESLDPDVLMSAQQELDQCDLCLVVSSYYVPAFSRFKLFIELVKTKKMY